MNNYYIIGIASFVVLVLSFYYFTKSENWDSSRYILSADTEGNLKPVSETYFSNKEKVHNKFVKDTVNGKLGHVLALAQTTRLKGQEGKTQHHNSWIYSMQQGNTCAQLITCRAGAVARGNKGYCYCAAFVN